MIDPTALLQFPGWLRNAMASGRSASELARLLGTAPTVIADLVGSVPTRPAEVRRLARRLGMDYESLRTFADDALQPLVGAVAQLPLAADLRHTLLRPLPRGAVAVGAVALADVKDYATSLYKTGGSYTGMDWGIPSLPAANEVSSCGEHHIVYFEKSVKLSGGTTGCGILVVEGDLDLSGGFLWHGIVIVTGAIAFSGGGEKNITGSVLSGSEMETDKITGDMVVLFCSSAVRQTDFLPLIVLSWKELY